MSETAVATENPIAEASETPPVLIRQPHGGALLPPVGHPDRPRSAPGFADPANRNAKGRPKAGAVVEEWIDTLAESERDHLERLVADKRTPSAKCIAAVQVLTARESGDLADYEPFLSGRMTLKELKASGVGMYRVKSAKVRRTVDANGEPVEVREIELHALAGPAFDRIMDRTVGKAAERKHVTVDISHLTPVPLVHLPAGYSPAPLPGRMPDLANLPTEAIEEELRRRGRLLTVEAVSRPAVDAASIPATVPHGEPSVVPPPVEAPPSPVPLADQPPAPSLDQPVTPAPAPRKRRSRTPDDLRASQRPAK